MGDNPHGGDRHCRTCTCEQLTNGELKGMGMSQLVATRKTYIGVRQDAKREIDRINREIASR